MSEQVTDKRTPPNLYLFYGDNTFAFTEAVRSLKSQFADSDSADLNTDHFEAGSDSLGRIEEVAASAPFLADRRLIIVDQADRLVSRQEERDRALSLFDRLPPTTRLVLLDRVELRGRDALAKYRQRSPLYQWAEANSSRSYHRAFVRPTGGAFVNWIQQRAKTLDGAIQPSAAQLLAEAVAEDLHLADQELRKLLTYVDFAREVEPDDVEKLTPLYRQSDVFAMVDAVGARDARQAMAHLQRLLQDDDPRYAFAMIARQFRLLLQASEAIANGKDPRQALSLHPYVAGKITQQARNFNLPQLEAIHQQLYELDLKSKIGQADLTTALDQLIIQLAH
ncbi:MAG: DNA polymerase III subunit delta [Anaerolineales bacterium]